VPDTPEPSGRVKTELSAQVDFSGIRLRKAASLRGWARSRSVSRSGLWSLNLASTRTRVSRWMRSRLPRRSTVSPPPAWVGNL